MKIAIVSYRQKDKFAQGVTNDEDTALIDFLLKKHLDVTPAIWNDEHVNWSEFQVALIKSPWDYHNNLKEFLLWLDKLEKLDVKILNPVEVIKWNSHKRYLEDISKKGLPVIPTEYLEKGSSFDSHYFDLLRADKLVLKPCISAGAQNTMIVDRENLTWIMH